MIPPKQCSKEPKAMVYLLPHSHFMWNTSGSKITFTSLPQGCESTLCLAPWWWYVLAHKRLWAVAGGERQGWKLSLMLVGRFLSNTGFCAVGWGQRLVILGIIHLLTKIKECNSWIHNILVLMGRKTTTMLCSQTCSAGRPKMWRLPLCASYCVLKQGDKDLQSPPQSVKACLPTVSGSDEMKHFHNWCFFIDHEKHLKPSTCHCNVCHTLPLTHPRQICISHHSSHSYQQRHFLGSFHCVICQTQPLRDH